MKVCHLTSAHSRYDVRIFEKECTSLARHGYETYLVARGESKEENGVHIIGVGNCPNNRIKRMIKFTRVVYKEALKLDCDIYHLHDPELLPYGLKLKKYGKKVIFDSHENTTSQIEEKKYIPFVLRRIISKLYFAFETKVVSKIDATIVPCTFDGKNIFEDRAKRTVYIANYPTITEFYNQYDCTIKKEYDCCYIGGLTYNRGIYQLVKSLKYGDIKLLLAGVVDEKFKSKLIQLPEYENVEYIGKISNKDVAKNIQRCIVGINTLLDKGQYYHVDTFGVKVLEYMSVGLPVIIFDSAYTRNMISKYNFGICVNANDEESIYRALIYIKTHLSEAKQMGENGRRAVREEFNWGTQEKKLVELYRSLE